MLAIWHFSTGYDILGLLHIASAIAAFGPLLVYPTLRSTGDTARMAKLHMSLVVPALVLLWVFGMGMAGMSEDTFKMSQTWLVLALADWVVLMVVSWFLIKPAITDGGDAADRRFSAGVGITHLGLAAGLVLMIWKPGAPAGF